MGVESVIARLEHLLATIPALVRLIDDVQFGTPREAGKWSPQQILGHLVDSAANNHQRLIRARYMDKPVVSYDQVQWNLLGHYADANREELLQFWEAFNRHLLHIFRHMDPHDLSKKYRVHDAEYDLEHMASDYMVHMEHHLHQFLSY